MCVRVVVCVGDTFIFACVFSCVCECLNMWARDVRPSLDLPRAEMTKWASPKPDFLSLPHFYLNKKHEKASERLASGSQTMCNWNLKMAGRLNLILRYLRSMEKINLYSLQRTLSGYLCIMHCKTSKRLQLVKNWAQPSVKHTLFSLSCVNTSVLMQNTLAHFAFDGSRTGPAASLVIPLPLCFKDSCFLLHHPTYSSSYSQLLSGLSSSGAIHLFLPQSFCNPQNKCVVPTNWLIHQRNEQFFRRDQLFGPGQYVHWVKTVWEKKVFIVGLVTTMNTKIWPTKGCPNVSYEQTGWFLTPWAASENIWSTFHLCKQVN